MKRSLVIGAAPGCRFGCTTEIVSGRPSPGAPSPMTAPWVLGVPSAAQMAPKVKPETCWWPVGYPPYPGIRWLGTARRCFCFARLCWYSTDVGLFTGRG